MFFLDFMVIFSWNSYFMGFPISWEIEDLDLNGMENGCRIVFGTFFASGFCFCLAFFPGTICLAFATFWN